MHNEETTVRSVSGLILKNHLSQVGETIPPESIEYVKSVIIGALGLQQDILRRTATQVIAMMMAILQPSNWLDGLSRLIQLLDSSNIDEAEVCTDSGSPCWPQLIALVPLLSPSLSNSGSLQCVRQDLRRYPSSIRSMRGQRYKTARHYHPQVSRSHSTPRRANPHACPQLSQPIHPARLFVTTESH